uniref:Uncharacterized protein n=1 Tax=Anguilla anguilla TaxID=7936 RepID=A0A0E9VWP5_ANGAN
MDQSLFTRPIPKQTVLFFIYPDFFQLEVLLFWSRISHYFDKYIKF